MIPQVWGADFYRCRLGGFRLGSFKPHEPNLGFICSGSDVNPAGNGVGGTLISMSLVVNEGEISTGNKASSISLVSGQESITGTGVGGTAISISLVVIEGEISTGDGRCNKASSISLMAEQESFTGDGVGGAVCEVEMFSHWQFRFSDYLSGLPSIQVLRFVWFALLDIPATYLAKGAIVMNM